MLLEVGATSPLCGSRLLPGLPETWCCGAAGRAGPSLGRWRELCAPWGFLEMVRRGVPSCRQGCACPLFTMRCVLRNRLYSGGYLRPRPFRGVRLWSCGAGLAPCLESGLGSRARPLSVPPHCLAAESRSRCCGGNRAPWLRGCRQPACNQGVGVGAFVLRWQPVWGDRPVSGVQVLATPDWERRSLPRPLGPGLPCK